MLSTSLLAIAFGIFALLQGLTRQLRPEFNHAIYRELPRSHALRYVIGTVLTLLGSVVLVGHSTFATWQTSVVTLFGWGMTLDGCVYLLLPQRFVERYMDVISRVHASGLLAVGYYVIGVTLLAAGLIR